MSTYSMTGFGRGQAENDDYEVVVEMKSVNHRFRDIRFKMPSQYMSIELDLRKKIEKKTKRGNFDVYINVKRRDTQNSFNHLDDQKIKAFVEKQANLIKGDNISIEVNPCDFLRSEFILDQSEQMQEAIHQLIHTSFEQALENLLTSRKREGEQLHQVIKAHLATFSKSYKVIQQFVVTGEFQKSLKEKLSTKIEELKNDKHFDENRFHQEVTYYLEKFDVSEEINRISTHLKSVDELLQKKSELGRKLEFLLQELNRETNTTGSKSSDLAISEQIVPMKVELEKIREQALNLE